MAYGTNDPKGLVPVSTMNGSQPTQALTGGQTPITCFITSGYGQNIGLGDPVMVANNFAGSLPANVDRGSIISCVEAGVVIGSNLVSISGVPIFGVFDGCFPEDDNALFPNPPGGQSAWYAGTTTSNPSGLVPCRVKLCALQQLYTIQVGATGAMLGAITNYGQFMFQVDGAGKVKLKGAQSTGYLEVAGGTGLAYIPDPTSLRTNVTANGASSLQILGFGNSLASLRNSQSQIGLPYGDVVVQIGAPQIGQFTPTSYSFA